MDYKKLYYKLCNYCKTTDINTRMLKRNQNDERVGKDYIYTEVHHIIPRHSGGSDSEINLVRMLPEEHFLAHLIRYKAYDDKNDFLAVRFLINGFKHNRRYNTHFRHDLLNKMVRTFKNEMADFRKKHNWQTDEGVKRISEARKGTMPAVCTKTGKMMGSFPVTHPKIVSGEWVHHTKGTCNVIIKETGKSTRIPVDEYHSNKHLYECNNGKHEGENNSKYSGFTDGELVEMYVELSKKISNDYTINLSTFYYYYRELKGLNIPLSFSSFRFSGKNNSERREKMLSLVMEKTKLPLINGLTDKKLVKQFKQKAKQIHGSNI